MEEGEQLLADPPSSLNVNYLKENYPPFAEWRTGKKKSSTADDVEPSTPDISEDTPEEALEKTVQQLRETLEAQVLDLVRKASPSFFEQVVVDLLIAMGYGGGDAAMGFAIGGSSDGGIDGKIKEDSLGLDEVYVQAKKYADANTVGAGHLRNFAGAIDAAGTSKGVFVTTAHFTQSAKDYVAKSPKRIVLIDGNELARLMVKHDVGVRTQTSYKIKRIDEDFFDQESL